MLMLLTLAALLLLATGWWLLRPTASSLAASGERGDLEQLRDRLVVQLDELDRERLDRGVEAGTAADEEQRLSAELADVLRRLELSPAATAVAADTGRPARWQAPVFVGSLLVVGLGVYTAMNVTSLQGLWLATRNPAAATAQVPPMVFEMVARLEKRLAEQPNDGAGWARLGRSYMVLQRPDEARNAYAKAYALMPDNVELLSDYAWVVFNADPGVTTGLVSDLYHRLYKLAPEHPDALWFLGFAAFQQGQFRQTLTYWERLQKLLPPDDPGRQHLQQAIDSVRAKLR